MNVPSVRRYTHMFMTAGQFTEYMQQEDPSSRAAVSARQHLQQCVVFELIVCKWNRFHIPHMDMLATETVDATWTDRHARAHRLYEIGNTDLLIKVVHLYLKRTLEEPGPALLYPHSLPLCRLVSYCLDKLWFSNLFIHIDNVQQWMRDRVQQLANCCTHPEMFELVVILAIAVKDWSLVIHTLNVRDFSVALLSRLLIWFSETSNVPFDAKDCAIRQLKRLFKKNTRHLPNVIQRDTKFKDLIAKQHVDKGRWHHIEGFVEQLTNETIINILLHRLAHQDEPDWEFVKQLIPKSSNKNALLAAFIKAIKLQRFQIANGILQRAILREDLGSPAIFSHFIIELLSGVLVHNSVETLMKFCAKNGMSTHWVFTLSLVRLPMFRENPSSLTTQAVNIGLVSYRDCFEHLQKFGSPGNSQRQEILDALQTEGTRPLVEVCRLTISHRIGFQPGRAERIDNLPLPGILTWMLSFGDVDGCSWKRSRPHSPR